MADGINPFNADFYFENWFALPLVTVLLTGVGLWLWGRLETLGLCARQSISSKAIILATSIHFLLGLWSGFLNALLYVAAYFETEFLMLFGIIIVWGADRLVAFGVWMAVPNWRRYASLYWGISFGLSPVVAYVASEYA